ncbi:MAG: hypothetical protein O3C40_34765, partial [Planctomycetota bacterium]|nr:hypothetical protein [Planctomycetota bacterium]
AKYRAACAAPLQESWPEVSGIERWASLLVASLPANGRIHDSSEHCAALATLAHRLRLTTRGLLCEKLVHLNELDERETESWKRSTR